MSDMDERYVTARTPTSAYRDAAADAKRALAEVST